jgi:glycosyl transferase family 2
MPRAPVSIISVFNDPEVRRDCLDRSIEQHGDPDMVEYLPIDNTAGSFATAGAALNHGADLARHDVLVFVHQDVYLHSLQAIEQAAGLLGDDDSIGLLGAVGVDAAGGVIGRVRDRVVLLGDIAPEPTDVASLDEVLFMIPRRLFERERLSEQPELAWHAYAVEYGVRVRALGMRVCALDVPLTHNSLTLNVERLNVAYEAVAKAHPDALPLRTTCGTVTARPRRRPPMVRSHGWRYRWLRESIAAHVGRRAIGGGACVLSDIRFDVDDLIAAGGDSSLLVVNMDRGGGSEYSDPLELVRGGRSVQVTSGDIPEALDAIAAVRRGTSVLITNLQAADLRTLARRLPPGPRLLGFRGEVGYWMLFGPAAETGPVAWRSPNAKPFAMPAPAG